MKLQPKNKITSLLIEAYHHLGINDVRALETMAKTAWEYLQADREHYIEAAEESVPEYYISTNYGVICKLVPLAREIVREQKKDHVREQTVILSLMLSDSGNRYVCSTAHARLYPDPEKNSYSYPVYRYAELETLKNNFQVYAPQEIRPAAAELDWEAYGMMFEAFALVDKSKILKQIPSKTERAMQVYAHTPLTSLTIDGKTYSGKLVPLASERSLWEDFREDHTYSYDKELCLLATAEKPCYVLKTTHKYSYFRKETYEDGGLAYLPTKAKREITYAFVTLSADLKKMYPV